MSYEQDVGPLGMVYELDPLRYPCGCVGRHVPEPKVNHRHHIWPLGWGGPDTKENTISVCPTSHANVHRLLDSWRRAGSPGPRVGNLWVYDLAMQGWRAAHA